MVQPGWKISDSDQPANAQDGNNPRPRANWGDRQDGADGANHSDEEAYDDDNQADGGDEAQPGDDEDERDENGDLSLEETKTYEEFKSKVTEQPFYGSDAEAYEDDEDEETGDRGSNEDDYLRDDFSLSDTGAQEYVEDMVDIDDDDEFDERRAREFFGDEEYTILSSVPEED